MYLERLDYQPKEPLPKKAPRKRMPEKVASLLFEKKLGVHVDYSNIGKNSDSGESFDALKKIVSESPEIDVKDADLKKYKNLGKPDVPKIDDKNDVDSDKILKSFESM